MAVTSKDLHTGQSSLFQRSQALLSSLEHILKRALPTRASKSASLMVLTALLMTMLLSLIGGWAQTKLDDLRYGRPRIDQLAAYVGHEQVEGMPTQLVAMNLNRRVVVLEFPGGDPNQVRTILGPYLFGAGEDLTPVTLDVRDLNGDEQPELLVNVKQEVLVYINEPDGFRAMTPEEHQQLASSLEKE